MDRRSWPWKKKSSEKTVPGPDSPATHLASAASLDLDNKKKANYVQISLDSYTHLMELENQVITLNEQVSELNEKLSVADSEITTKEGLVKQHTKVAEEAVSGWEKAEAEALALKDQLESVTLLKLTAEERASQLDGAVKECVKQIRNLKEDHERKLHETVLTKTKQWEKIKLELEAKMAELDRELVRSSAENAALSRSLQDRSSMLMDITEEKAQAEAEIERLKIDIESCEREISSLNYEVHLVTKELEIRNEENKMSIRSAEVANKQHLESAKKITKLETECQRLRGLVRKKLPGPAALAQMRLEVEHLGRDHGETRFRQSPGRNNTHLGPVHELSLDNIQQYHRENEFLTARLSAMEEETKMLQEALVQRNIELQESRNMFTQTATKLREFEAQLQVLNQHKTSRKLDFEMSTEGSSGQDESMPPSLASMYIDESNESELSHFNKKKQDVRTSKVDHENHVKLMDDFLEMERLACSPTESYGSISTPDSLVAKGTKSIDVSPAGTPRLERKPALEASNPTSANEISEDKAKSETSDVSLSELRSRISTIFDSKDKDADIWKFLNDIKCAVQEFQDVLPTVASDQCLHETDENLKSSLIGDSKLGHDTNLLIEQEYSTAVSTIHDFVMSLSKEAMAVLDNSPRSPRGHTLKKIIEEFSEVVTEVLCKKTSISDFLLVLSHVLAKSGELSITVLGYKGSEGGIDSSDCIDKVTLLENEVVQNDLSREITSRGCSQVCRSSSDTEDLQEGSLAPGSDSKRIPCKCFLELEELKSEKEKMVMELAKCTENLEKTTSKLQETEQLMVELKSQLVSSQNSNSLTETQLKCMVESYKSLETRSDVLQTEVDLLRTKLDTVNKELQEEKQDHENALVNCKDLQEKLQRSESCSICGLSSAEDTDIKSKQEIKIAAATEKLAECQETIFLLGKQLKDLNPSVDQAGSEYIEKHEMNVNMVPKEDSESPSNVFDSSSSPSSTEANLLLRSPINSKDPKDGTTKSSFSSSQTPDKTSRGFSRFFSSKSKHGH